jgi:glycosyl transferase, family 25
MKPMKPCVLLINLDRSPERLANMNKRLAALPWPWERVPAIDGPAQKDFPAQEVDEHLYRRRHGRDLPRGEIGCYLSHVRAMKQFLAGESSHLLLLEDDAVPGPDFGLVVQALLEQPEHWDLVKLSGFHSGGPLPVRPLVKGYRLAVPFARQANTAALLMTRACARSLVHTLLPMSLPYDHALEQPWVHGQRLRIVTPPPCAAADDTGTTVAMHSTRKLRGLKRLPAHAFRLRNEVRRLAWAAAQVLARPRA